MKSLSRRSVFLLAVLLFIAPAGAAESELSGKILMLAAASTTDAIDAIRAEFIRQHPQVTVRVSYGASSALAKQIIGGAEADLFLSASTEWSAALAKEKLIDRQRDLLGNQLVIVVPADSKLVIKQVADLAGAEIRHLALADPKSVPAGVYARQALEKLGLWKDLEKRVAGAADVRQALHFVETGAAEAGIVYATDAAASKAVRVALTIDPKLTDPIRYPLVLLKHGAENRAAAAFYDFLSQNAATAVFLKKGFQILPTANDKP